MKKFLFITVIITILFFIIYYEFRGSEQPGDPRGYAYAGSAKCMKCHGDLYNSYIHTAHYAASLPATGSTVHGSFANGSNVYTISPTQKIVMEKLNGSMFQTYYLNGKVKERHRFDIVLGGVKGESYLSWEGNGLNQLPISYFTQQAKWQMSPGYAPGMVDFGRIITSRCIECHGSFIADQPTETQKLDAAEQFDKSTMVFSIDCERCHGPGAKHVEYHTNNPNVKTPVYMVSYHILPRALRMDMCGVCHSGNKSQMLRSTFAFKPGDNLANFKLPDFVRASDTGHLDVHGNQIQLLESSKCFINSNMDCATCHNTHQNQRGNIALFTQKCLGCHSTVNHNYCKLATAQNATLIKLNCIKCHMPTLLSRVILTPNANQTSTADIYVRSHHITIYPQETKKILLMIGK